MTRARYCRGAAALLACFIGPACEELPEVPNVPPTAAFIHTPVSPIFAGGTVVTFNATGSRDSDGRITNYSWDFGDGTPPVTSDGPTTTHVFPDTPAFCQETVYTALLTVRDDGNDTSSASGQVHVFELPLPTSPECEVDE
jgi:PKD repeat protein